MAIGHDPWLHRFPFDISSGLSPKARHKVHGVWNAKKHSSNPRGGDGGDGIDFPCGWSIAIQGHSSTASHGLTLLLQSFLHVFQRFVAALHPNQWRPARGEDGWDMENGYRKWVYDGIFCMYYGIYIFFNGVCIYIYIYNMVCIYICMEYILLHTI